MGGKSEQIERRLLEASGRGYLLEVQSIMANLRFDEATSLDPETLEQVLMNIVSFVDSDAGLVNQTTEMFLAKFSPVVGGDVLGDVMLAFTQWHDLEGLAIITSYIDPMHLPSMDLWYADQTISELARRRAQGNECHIEQTIDAVRSVLAK